MTSFNVIRPNTGNHYGIFIEISELICFSIRELGFEAKITPGAVDLGRVNIVIGVFYDEAFFEALPADSIILNTEQLFSTHAQSDEWTAKLLALGKRFPLWDYNSRNIEMLNLFGVNNVKLFQFGFQRELQRIPKKPLDERVIDVLFYGSMNDRRRGLLTEIESKGLSMLELFGTYGYKRDIFISQSKIVLNTHFCSQQIVEVVRVHYLLNNGVAVVSEINPSTSVENRYLESISSAPFSEIADRCAWLISHPSDLEALQVKALETFKSIPQVTFTGSLLSGF